MENSGQQTPHLIQSAPLIQNQDLLPASNNLNCLFYQEMQSDNIYNSLQKFKNFIKYLFLNHSFPMISKHENIIDEHVNFFLSEVVAYDYDRNNDGICLLYRQNNIWTLQLHYFIDEALTNIYPIQTEENLLLDCKFFHLKRKKHIAIVGANYIYFINLNVVNPFMGILLKQQNEEFSPVYKVIKNDYFSQITFTMGSFYYILWSPFVRSIQIHQHDLDIKENLQIPNYFNQINCSYLNQTIVLFDSKGRDKQFTVVYLPKKLSQTISLSNLIKKNKIQTIYHLDIQLGGTNDTLFITLNNFFLIYQDQNYQQSLLQKNRQALKYQLKQDLEISSLIGPHSPECDFKLEVSEDEKDIWLTQIYKESERIIYNHYCIDYLSTKITNKIKFERQKEFEKEAIVTKLGKYWNSKTKMNISKWQICFNQGYIKDSIKKKLAIQ